jgi:hypothetical protein
LNVRTQPFREFELDSGLKPTGRVSSEVFGRLGRVVAAAKPKPKPKPKPIQ